MSTIAVTASRQYQPGMTATVAKIAGGRLRSIDALRGFVMVLMLLDHVRETWFLHVDVADPVDARTIMPALFFARLAASLCAPIFVALTGLGVFLYSRNHTPQETSSYLLKRGLLLMAIEVFFLSPIYWGIAQPTLWLQVIWCIGVCMIVLAGLFRLPLATLIVLGLVIVAGHNLLDPIRLAPDAPFHTLWALLHQRDLIALPFGLMAKTSYPVLAWIGVILLGFGIGPWFLPHIAPQTRQRRLLLLGVGMIALFIGLRLLNIYGDKPWFIVADDPARTAMSFLSLTKYPPSLDFLLFTLGVGSLLLAFFDRIRDAGVTSALAVFGGAPMFFYIFHLCMLRLLYHTALAIWGPTQGSVFGFDGYGWVFAWYLGLIIPFYIPTAWFSQLKARRKDIAWLKYF
ncbi:DUF1624 domain-containing protein [Niveispirillum sp.]|uniref:DUF1624 domain-containing protein n=1 Tax=Niveispirillum sp. TaxID=1917217 RepID=UPI001B5BBDC6|nr:heparan-alpha-glucosaminide N-acetyltransferase domain-containing protein [Niveispirillum sp.]MBP7340117.1 DUF1624 domain-containing protein [Niveispirillum sp.]